ncbi:tRNA lysidine(34) synthetase TilS [Thermoanaerobacterium sp. RBIITD]|uniref:tRNA lysidine(34) synthetase TilS n=1 Tax=Thermoanaerobacterium sp. RBIITD TaxID=1550240 RepID=UPI000BB8BE95|nr:tRNA lysidine(34) synthetase TilS [Thermoanaerobacterium sp. RBIITD]SNX54289.1 tRNA(Ile)-lysidine synthase [Thermoanaerobacterium sp. RBIITD]
MIDSVIKTIKKYNMIRKNDSIVVGVSGGPDSLCLLNLLYEIKVDYNLKLYVVHVNHMLRGQEADCDAAFVEDTCRGMGIPFFLFKVDVKKYAAENGLSEESAGRTIRYKAFFDILKKENAYKIAVAHNKNDVAETILLNILRGSGTTGLIGIKPVNGNIIRPLIETDRREILKYLESKNLKPVIDSTNNEDIYRRNRIRLKLIPFIEKNFNIDIVENLYRTSQIITDDDNYLNIECEKIFKKISTYNKEGLLLNIDGIREVHDALKKRLIRMAYKAIKGDINGLTYKHVEDVLKLMDKQTSSKIDMPFEIEVIKSYNNLIFRKRKPENKGDIEVKLIIPGITNASRFGTFKTKVIDIKDVGQLDTGKYHKLFDMDMINDDVIIRKRKTGDVISPLNMKGTKTLKEYFIDEKVPREMRDTIPLLAIGNCIVWIVGYRMSDKYKVNEKTKRVLSIEYIKNN